MAARFLPTCSTWRQLHLQSWIESRSRHVPSTLRISACRVIRRRWVCALAGLHDLGKASPAFQQLWAPGAARVRETGLTWCDRNPPDPIPHGLITQRALDDLLLERGWEARAAQHAADAVSAHHGFRATADELRIGLREEGRGPLVTARGALVSGVLAALEVGVPPPSGDSAAGHTWSPHPWG